MFPCCMVSRRSMKSRGALAGEREVGSIGYGSLREGGGGG